MAADEHTHKFPCPKCGAEVDFDAEQGTLACAYCGFSTPVPVTEKEIQEYDLEFALQAMIDAPQEMGYGDEKRSIKCESCGAVNTLDAHVVSTECAFCGSNQVVVQEHVAQVVKPESLLPFQVEQREAVTLFRQWLGRGFFRPNPVRKIAKDAGAKLQGVYLPFWTFDAYTSSWWRAEAGHYYTVSETYWATDDRGSRVQRTRDVQKIRWEPASGHLPLSFDEVLVPATQSVEQDMVERIYPFDTESLVPYEPGFLSGWGAEAYAVDLREAWATGQVIIQQRVRAACAREVPGDTQRNLQVDTAFSNMTYKHVLFPVWIASYRYQNKVYHFLINGQTGEVQGQAPISWIKVALVVIVALIILSCLFLLFSLGESGAALNLYRAVLGGWPEFCSTIHLRCLPFATPDLTNRASMNIMFSRGFVGAVTILCACVGQLLMPESFGRFSLSDEAVPPLPLPTGASAVIKPGQARLLAPGQLPRSEMNG